MIFRVLSRSLTTLNSRDRRSSARRMSQTLRHPHHSSLVRPMADQADPMTAVVIVTVRALRWAAGVTLRHPMMTTMIVVARPEVTALAAMTTAVVPLPRVTSTIAAIGMGARLPAAFPLMISAPLVLVTTPIPMSLAAGLPHVATMTHMQTDTVVDVPHMMPVPRPLAAAVVVEDARAHLPVVLPMKAITLPAVATRKSVVTGRAISTRRVISTRVTYSNFQECARRCPKQIMHLVGSGFYNLWQSAIGIISIAVLQDRSCLWTLSFLEA